MGIFKAKQKPVAWIEAPCSVFDRCKNWNTLGGYCTNKDGQRECAKQNLWYELRHPVQVLACSQVSPTDSLLVPGHPQLQFAGEAHSFPIIIIRDEYELNSIKIKDFTTLILLCYLWQELFTLGCAIIHDPHPTFWFFTQSIDSFYEFEHFWFF